MSVAISMGSDERHTWMCRNTENPYESPGSTSVSNVGDQQHLGMIVGSAFVGGLLTVAALYSIYVNDPRTGTSGPSLEFVLFGGGALSAVIWAASGWFQRYGMIGFVLTIVIASVTAVLWVVIGGTYADVVAAAATAGWPCGGLAAAVGQYFWWRSTRRPASPESTDS